MFKVLHIMACSDAGGISSVVLNYYRWMDRNEFQFDIALTVEEEGLNTRLLRELGAEIFHLPLKSKGIAAFETALQALLSERQYDAIHVHENETSYVALRIAKKMGVKCRIAHSHTTSPYVSVKGEVRRLSGCVLNYHYATAVIGCGQVAGERVFGKRNMRKEKAYVLPNAIDTEKYRYNKKVRNEMRKALGVEEQFVVGMVGRLSPEKNHLFALDFFRYMPKEIPNVKLLLIGNGPDEGKIKAHIKKYKMEPFVQLLGRRSDVYALYQAFDVLIMPSNYEGFPVAAVEAMASGLPILLSDKITRELDFCKGVEYLPLKKQMWIEALKKVTEKVDREIRQHEPKNNGLDIRDTAQMLERIYKN